jgi:hypothetical protein
MKFVKVGHILSSEMNACYLFFKMHTFSLQAFKAILQIEIPQKPKPSKEHKERVLWLTGQIDLSFTAPTLSAF